MRAAAKGKGQWATLARSALGMVLLRQGKHQQAVFELRKVASVTPPTVLSAHGWGLVVYALRESKNMKEAERARGEHKKVLIKLTQSKSPEDAAIGNFMLGMEYKFDGDRTLAKQHFTTALAGPLPGPERLQCEAALKEV
jgi:Flp pilus assembly protein TadD